MEQTTVFTKFRPSTVAGKEGSIYHQFIHKRKVKTVTSPYKIYPEEWNDELSTIRLGIFNARRERYLQEINISLKEDVERIKDKIIWLENRGSYALEEVVSLYKNQSSFLFIDFVNELIPELEASNQLRLIEAYLGASSNLKAFNGGKEVALDAINAKFMRSYETWMRNKGNSLNTISFYSRNTRAIYNKAIKRGLIDRQKEDPFSDIFTGIAKTKKRAIKQDIMNNLLKLDLSGMDIESDIPDEDIKKLKKSTIFARDMFILSFYLRGISFIDLAYLKKSNLNNGYITYVRHKTGQYFEIAINAKIQKIIDKYAGFCKKTDLLLPILADGNTRKDYLNALKRQNKHLKYFSKMMGIDKTLTTYVTRHSWASIALSKGYSISVICQGLGHESEKTTKIYLDSFDYSMLHKANNEITDFYREEKNYRRKCRSCTLTHT